MITSFSNSRIHLSRWLLRKSYSKSSEDLHVRHVERHPATDSRHFFWEEMKRIFFAMREIEPEDLNEEVMSQLMDAVDELSNALYRIEQIRAKRLKKAENLAI
jgi:hypothetical protein